MLKSLIVAVLMVLGWISLPAHAGFCPGVTPWVFDDVLDTDPFCGFITDVANRGVTLGCQIIDANHRLYCPTTAVPREQMAAFLSRLASNQAAISDARYFRQGGNAFGAIAVLGTTDGYIVDILANGKRAIRIAPSPATGFGDPPNVTIGDASNLIARTCASPSACLAFEDLVGAVIGGGGWGSYINRVSDNFGVVAGGAGNFAGNNNEDPEDANFATVGGGFLNRASGSASVVSGGAYNLASGFGSTVAGGLQNIASGDYSFAAGFGARADAKGCFVWNDAESGGPITCGAAQNRVVMRATGGFIFLSNASNNNGAELQPNTGAWTTYSDRAGKENVETIAPREVLDRLVNMPIATWNWKGETGGVRHMGPMAQDFHAAFGLGSDERRINTVDADGVALAAIQGLNAKLETRIAEQAREIAELKRAVEVLFARTSPEGRLAAR